MEFNPSIFSCEISGVRYKWAERSMREIETVISAENAAFEAQEFSKVKQIQYEFVFRAMKDAGGIETADELKDLGSPTFNALHSAIVASQGIKLEAKNLGENLASQNS